MTDFLIPRSKGRKTSGDELAFPPGFSTKLTNVVFLPNDAERVHKIPGRTVASVLGSPQTTTPYGITYLQFDNDQNKIVLLANSKFYESTAGPTLSSWSSANDQNGSPFSRTGTRIKSIEDGRNMNIVWSGADNERALVRDQDGNWRMLSMNKPALAPTVAAVTTTPTYTRPGSNAQGTGTSPTSPHPSITGAYSDPTLAYDQNLLTYAHATLSTPATAYATDYIFSGGTTINGQTLNVKLATSSLAGFGPGTRQRQPSGGGGTGPPPEPLEAKTWLAISVDGGTNYTYFYNAPAPTVATTIQYTISAGGAVTFDSLRVRALFEYISGTQAVSSFVFEVWVQDAGSGASTATVAAGTYYYVTTEVYSVSLTSGRTILVESAPSDASVITTVGTEKGIKVTPSAQQNGLAQGFKNDPTNFKFLKRYIYRTTTTGAYPDLGFVGEMAIDGTYFIDTFESVSGTTLGTPSISVVYLGDGPYPLSGPAPSFVDATNHKGAIFVIPKDDPYTIRWSPPGYPEYFPVPHNFAFLPTDRNDRGRGIVSIGDAVVVFTRNRVLRVRDVPMVTSPNFDLTRLNTDILSPSEGLAGSPRGYCLFHSAKGHALCAWISDSGIWMTDGTLVSERGLGVVRLSVNIDWPNDVDTSRLEESALSFDSVMQAIYFDYYDPAGSLQTAILHTAAEHWIDTGQDQQVPKLSGPHTLTALSRSIGEQSGVIRHWSLSPADSRIYLERNGDDNGGHLILSHVESPWIYPAGGRDLVHVYQASLYHSDWGASETCELDLLVRHDNTGVIQVASSPSVSLRGTRITSLGLLGVSGQCLREIIRHTGKTTSLGTPLRAFGPTHLDLEQMDDIRAD